MKRVIIWGLKETRHSHRFIHKGFYENFSKLGYETKWLEDESRYQIDRADLVFASGMAVKNLKIQKNVSYIFHNVTLNESQIENINRNKIRHINIQVFTSDAKGITLDNQNISYDESTKTLYQPWGTPLNQDEWWPYQPKNASNIEWWVGSVWNNNLNQGNKAVIKEYKRVLTDRKTLFIKRGGSRFRLNGISEAKNARLIRKSKYAATIVGNWQRETHYIPCRLFKNLSYGMPIISNMEKPKFVSSNYGFNQNLVKLLEFAENESEQSRRNRFFSERDEIAKFTYEQNIKRIVGILENA